MPLSTRSAAISSLLNVSATLGPALSDSLSRLSRHDPLSPPFPPNPRKREPKDWPDTGHHVKSCDVLAFLSFPFERLLCRRWRPLAPPLGESNHRRARGLVRSTLRRSGIPPPWPTNPLASGRRSATCSRSHLSPFYSRHCCRLSQPQGVHVHASCSQPRRESVADPLREPAGSDCQRFDRDRISSRQGDRIRPPRRARR